MYECESCTIKKAGCWRTDAFELWCWKRFLRVLGLQGDPTSPSWRKSVLNIHWKDWYWSWNSNTLATWWEELTHFWKHPDAGKDWRQGEKEMTEDVMVGWHYRPDGHEFELAPGVGDGQGGLVCCGSWGCKESGMTEWLNWTELMGLDAMIFISWMLSFKPAFSLSSFTFIKSSLVLHFLPWEWCHLHIWGYWYFSL